MEYHQKFKDMFEMKALGREWVKILVLCKQIKAFEIAYKGLRELYRQAKMRELKASRIARCFFRRIVKYGRDEDQRQ